MDCTFYLYLRFFVSDNEIDILAVRALVLWDNSGFSNIICNIILTERSLDRVLSIPLKMLILFETIIKLIGCIKSDFKANIGIS